MLQPRAAPSADGGTNVTAHITATVGTASSLQHVRRPGEGSTMAYQHDPRDGRVSAAFQPQFHLQKRERPAARAAVLPPHAHRRAQRRAANRLCDFPARRASAAPLPALLLLQRSAAREVCSSAEDAH